MSVFLIFEPAPGSWIPTWTGSLYLAAEDWRPRTKREVAMGLQREGGPMSGCSVSVITV